MTDRPLNILITNSSFGLRTGTEVVVRDFSLGLLARGHSVTVYSPVLDTLAEETRAKGVRVVDNLLELEDPPDLIHGHHLSQTAEALVRFPRTPAIWICHSSDGWIDAPPIFPQIRTYAAVDEISRERVAQALGVASEEVTILPNAVDLDRTAPRETALAHRPRRGLVFGKATASTPLIAECCRLAGIELAAIGYDAGTTTADPEPELAKADIVFGSARAALEAIAAGAAVVVMDGRGVAGMASTANFDFMRRNNFGLRTLAQPVTSAAILDAIGRYDAADATRLCATVRREADLGRSLDRLEELYRRAIADFDADAQASRSAEALSRFLHEWLPNVTNGPGFWRDEYGRLTTHIAELTKIIAHYQLEAHRQGELAEAARREVEALSHRHADQQNRIAELEGEIETMRRSRPYRLGRWLRHSRLGRLVS